MDAALADFGLPVLRACLRRRAAFRTAALEGVSVYQLGSRGAAAAADIEALIEEVFAS
jgi:chromosome partitioning protein